MARRPRLSSCLDSLGTLAVALAAVVVSGSLIASMPAVAGVVPDTTTFAVEQTEHEVSGLDNVVVDGHERGYDDGVTAVTIYLNNTGSDLSADVRVGLEDASGTVLVEQTKEGKLLSPGVNEITFTFSRGYAPENVAVVRTTAASSL